MAEQHDVQLANGKTVTVTADPSSNSYYDMIADRIINEVGQNPMRTMFNAGSFIVGIVGYRRGRIDSARIRRIEEAIKSKL